jgi:dihydrofolate synthase/folylpolyglutamate synthase
MHQRANAALALRALELAPAFAADDRAVRAGLAGVRWPGRLQIVSTAPLVLLDGAHNPAGIEVLVAEVRRLVGERPLRVLFGAMRDKAWRPMLDSLRRIARETVVTRPSQARSADPSAIAASSGGAVRVHEDPIAAYRALVAASAPGDAVLVTGSLFLIGDVLTAIDPGAAADAARERAATRAAGR